ncbi:MAG: sigma-70 family RNA polymerase sigma factor [Paramuribaculum sp.]|nr:sigma-70 family RNA polymerase sigma factor [Paramuribaculum sp.]
MTAVLSLFSKIVAEETDTVRTEEFLSIVKHYDGLISRICFGFARSRLEMEDYRQDVFLNIWQALPRFRGESSLKTWLYRIALNTCVSTIRKAPRPYDSTLPEIIDEDQQRRIQLMELHDMISLLPPTDKAILLLWLEETSYEDIAEITGLPRNTVATRLKRAKEKLMKLR